jgi:hypothetical protein
LGNIKYISGTLGTMPLDKVHPLLTFSSPSLSDSILTLEYLGNHECLNEGTRLLDARAGFHFYATGITPAMAKKIIGKGSKYAFSYTDSNGNIFDGNKTYKVHLPPNVSAKDF